MDPLEIGYKLATIYVPFVIALCFHEYAHGWMAMRKGDNTALQMGRLSMNPLVHMDMVGTVLLPMLAIFTHLPIFFGWAKPVPFNPRNLSNPKSDTFWIALAGPLSNILLAVVSSLIIALMVRLPTGLLGLDWQKAVGMILVEFIRINLFLAIFNMIPLNPLDGGKVLARFLPISWNYKLEQNEAMTGLILMALIMTGALRFLAIPVEMTARVLVGLATMGT